MINDKHIYPGSKFICKNNNVIFEVLEIYEGSNGLYYVKIKDYKNAKRYDVLKNHFKHLLLDPIIEN